MASQIDKPVAVDLFSGVGGMSLGFEWAGFRVPVAVEFDPVHARTYRANFPGTTVIEKDIRLVSGAEILASLSLKKGDVDVVFGGPPCQGFSSIGKRDPEDPRNDLLFEFSRLVLEILPKYFVLENVTGLVRETGKKHLLRFKEAIGTHYCIVQPERIVDAKDFGVPQVRKRVFLLGYRKGLQAPEYPEPTNTRITVWDAIADLPTPESHPELAVSGTHTGPLPNPGSDYAAFLRSVAPLDDRPLSGSLTGLQATFHTPEVIERFERIRPGEVEPVSRYKRLAKEGQAPTLRAGTGADKGSFMAARPIHPDFARCITTREAARLHSFPDWFQFDETKWHAARQIGNSVPPLLAKEIAHRVIITLYEVVGAEQDG